jgi:hypothetical protein
VKKIPGSIYGRDFFTRLAWLCSALKERGCSLEFTVGRPSIEKVARKGSDFERKKAEVLKMERYWRNLLCHLF